MQLHRRRDDGRAPIVPRLLFALCIPALPRAAVAYLIDLQVRREIFAPAQHEAMTAVSGAGPARKDGLACAIISPRFSRIIPVF